MNSIQVIVLSMVIIVKWESVCFCKEYYLKIVEHTDTKLERLQHSMGTWDLLSKMFQYDGSVTVMTENFIRKDLTWHNSFIHLLQKKLGLAVTVVEVSERSNQTSTVNKLNNYGRNTNTSYILIMDDIKIHSLFLEEAKKISVDWNSRAHFAIITYDEILPEILEVFRQLWTTYGIGKVTTFDIISGHVAIYNLLKDTIQALNVSNVEKIFEYSSPEKDLEGYPIKVTMVHNPPTSIAIPNSTRFYGVNQILLDTLENQMNFTTVMCKPTFRDKFGVETDFGTVSDTLTQVANRKIDVDANMKFITSTNISGLEFTTPFFTERIHFVVPKTGRIPIWLSTYQIFDNTIWMPTTCLFIIFVVFWLCLMKFYYNSHLGWNVGSVIINILFLLTGQSISKSVNKFLERVLVFFGSIFAIIMVSCFTGNLFQRFSEVSYYPDINNLQQLKKSGLPLVVGSFGVVNALNETEDLLLKSTLNKIDNYNNLSTAFDVNNGVFDHAVLARLTQIKYELASHTVENNGTRLLHMMKESLGRFSMAYIVPKGWFFSEHFNKHISRILEGGLIQKWYGDTMFIFQLRSLTAQFASYENLPRAFTLSDLNLAWYVLSIGLAISCVTILIEIHWDSQILKKVQITFYQILNLFYKK